MKIKKIVLLVGLTLGLNADTGIVAAEGFSDRVMPNDRNDIVLSYNNAIKFASRGVVNISTKRRIKGKGLENSAMNDPFFRDYFGDNLGSYLPKEKLEKSLGSGVIISKDGYILTNYHVINGAEEVIVTLKEAGLDKEYIAKVVGSDEKSDLAVIRISVDNLNPLAFADSSKIMVGDIVFAIGNPFGVGESVSQGIISGINKNGFGASEYEDFIQTDAKINPGNSGGALIDSRGHIVGINCSMGSKNSQTNAMGFAIPANMAKKIADGLILKGQIDRGYLGISINDINKDLHSLYGKNYGTIIVSLDKNGTAFKSGLRRGDLIIGVNGNKIENGSVLKNVVGNLAPNDIIRVDIVRDGERKAYNVELGRLSLLDTPMSGARTFEGLILDQLTPEERKTNRLPSDATGIVVAKVMEESKAEGDGFIVGDIIMQVEDVMIADINDLKRAYQLYKTRAKRVYVTRNGFMKILVVR